MNEGKQQALLLLLVVTVVLVGGLGLYNARQSAELMHSNRAVAAALADLQHALSQLRATQASAPTGAAQSGIAPDAAPFIAALRAALTPLTQRVAALESSLRQRPSVPFPSKVAGGASDFSMPMLSIAPGQGCIPRLPQGQTPSPAQAEVRQKIESVLARNAEQARQQIAAETDPENPDPVVLQRIMEQSQSDIRWELSRILTPEEYEAMFPPIKLEGPVASGGHSGTR